MLSVTDYTQTATPLLDHLQKKFPDGIGVSDIQDTLGRQYVDLVQEGGGVHGIALAGYTYILEKMGIAFMKMAGTSAGSINTLLLNAVNTRAEAERLDLDPNNYHETRSEKVLEYLSGQDLRDFVDGPSPWQKLILGLFTPSFKQRGIKGFLRQHKTFLIWDAGFLVLLVLTGFFLAFYARPDSSRIVAQWMFILSFVGMVITSTLFYLRIRYAHNLYKLVERFGINPGDIFEKWVEVILVANGIHSVQDLTDKLEREKNVLQPKFRPYTTPVMTPASVAEPPFLSNYKSLFAEIEDTSVPVEVAYAHFCSALNKDENLKLEHRDAFLQRVLRAFEARLSHDPVVTKEMVIVSSDITHGIKVEFPGMHKMYWGNNTSISPAKYVRASMSVPVFFRPMEVTFEKGEQNTIKTAWAQLLKVHQEADGHALFVDGGLLSNFPINVFHSAAMPVPRKPTFGIKLEYENEIDSRTIRSIKDLGGSMLNTMRYFYDRDFALKQDLYKKTVRSVDTGKVHWLNFNLSDEEKIELFFRGALAATIFLSSCRSTETETRELLEHGSKVPVQNNVHSIYSDGKIDFKIEDLLLPNVTFEWQAYKLERLLERISKEERRGEIKESAAMQNFQGK